MVSAVYTAKLNNSQMFGVLVQQALVVLVTHIIWFFGVCWCKQHVQRQQLPLARAGMCAQLPASVVCTLATLRSAQSLLIHMLSFARTNLKAVGHAKGLQ